MPAQTRMYSSAAWLLLLYKKQGSGNLVTLIFLENEFEELVICICLPKDIPCYPFESVQTQLGPSPNWQPSFDDDDDDDYDDDNDNDNSYPAALLPAKLSCIHAHATAEPCCPSLLGLLPIFLKMAAALLLGLLLATLSPAKVSVLCSVVHLQVSC